MKKIAQSFLAFCLITPFMSLAEVNVQYGNEGWVEKEVNAEVKFKCNNGQFGVDPLKGSQKYCYVNGSGVAAEGGEYKGVQKFTVKYGRRSYNGKNFPDGKKVKCDNSTFGDPLKGTSKVCKIGDKIVAQEGQEFWTSTPKCTSIKVFYGNNGIFANKTFQLGKEYKCHNGEFGDPLQGQKKVCRLHKTEGPYLTSEGKSFTLSGSDCP